MDASAGAAGSEALVEPPFERVYTVMDFYDVPHAGFADFEGVPHAYRSIFRDDLDDYDSEYRLWPVSAEVLAAARSDFGSDARRRIVKLLESPPTSARRVVAEFRDTGGGRRPGFLARKMEVRWTPTDTQREAAHD